MWFSSDAHQFVAWLLMFNALVDELEFLIARNPLSLYGVVGIRSREQKNELRSMGARDMHS